MRHSDGRALAVGCDVSKADEVNTAVERIAAELGEPAGLGNNAGIMWVQPGIESLHSEVLALMDKGIQGWQNVQLLKWARELGLRLSWSILWGFPGEKDDWYEDMAEWLPALAHLPPPAATPRVRYDRYSVYHEQASQLGLILFPIGALSLVYPVGPGDLDALAYFFTTEPNSGPLRIIQSLSEAVTNNPGIGAVTRGVRDWSAAHRSGELPVLASQDRAGVLEITDTRACARTSRQLLTGLSRAVLLACDSAPRPAHRAGGHRVLLRLDRDWSGRVLCGRGAVGGFGAVG